MPYVFANEKKYEHFLVGFEPAIRRLHSSSCSEPCCISDPSSPFFRPTAAVAVHAKWTVFLALVLFPRGLLFVVAVTVAATVVVTGGRALLTSLS